jgi:hypothetical protein
MQEYDALPRLSVARAEGLVLSALFLPSALAMDRKAVNLIP